MKPQTEDVSDVLSLPWRLPIPAHPLEGRAGSCRARCPPRPEEGVGDAGVCPRRLMLLPWVPSPPTLIPARCPAAWPIARCPSCVTMSCTGARHPRDYSRGPIPSLFGCTALPAPARAGHGAAGQALCCKPLPAAAPAGGHLLCWPLSLGVRPVFAAALRPRSSPPSLEASPGRALLLQEDDLAVRAPPLPLLASPQSCG